MFMRLFARDCKGREHGAAAWVFSGDLCARGGAPMPELPYLFPRAVTWSAC